MDRVQCLLEDVPLLQRGKSLNSWRSRSPTSLPASLNHSLQSPSKTHLNSKPIYNTALESVDHIQSNYTGIAINGNVARYNTTMGDAMEKDQDIQKDNCGNHILLNPSNGVTNLTKPFVTGDLSPGLVKETEGICLQLQRLISIAILNQEFGIVDKYIRSSSGWGELSLENSISICCDISFHYGLSMELRCDYSVNIFKKFAQ
ncbi:hypothetical protein Lal_00049331, partial [Lupinus albus]